MGHSFDSSHHTHRTNQIVARTHMGSRTYDPTRPPRRPQFGPALPLKNTSYMPREERARVPAFARDREPLALQPPRPRDSVLKLGANYLVGKLGQAAVFTAGKLAEGTFKLIFN